MEARKPGGQPGITDIHVYPCCPQRPMSSSCRLGSATAGYPLPFRSRRRSSVGKIPDVVTDSSAFPVGSKHSNVRKGAPSRFSREGWSRERGRFGRTPGVQIPRLTSGGRSSAGMFFFQVIQDAIFAGKAIARSQARQRAWQARRLFQHPLRRPEAARGGRTSRSYGVDRGGDPAKHSCRRGRPKPGWVLEAASEDRSGELDEQRRKP